MTTVGSVAAAGDYAAIRTVSALWYGPGRVLDASRTSREREEDGVSDERLGYT